MGFFQNAALKKALKIYQQEGLTTRVPIELRENVVGQHSRVDGRSDKMLVAYPPGQKFSTVMFFDKWDKDCFSYSFGETEDGVWHYQELNVIKAPLGVTDHFDFGIALFIQITVAVEMSLNIKSGDLDEDERDFFVNQLTQEFGVDPHLGLREIILTVIRSKMNERIGLSTFSRFVS